MAYKKLPLLRKLYKDNNKWKAMKAIGKISRKVANYLLINDTDVLLINDTDKLIIS